MEPSIALLALALGALAGGVATFLGIGGGSVIVPLLVAAGIPPKTASPASLVAILGTSIGGLRYLYRRGLVEPRTALTLETATTIGALLGVAVFDRVESRMLLLLLAAALAGSALGMRVRSMARGGEGYRWPPPLGRLAAALGASFVAGLISALLGVGGGIIKVPVLVLLLGMPIHMAVSTSKMMVGITALVGVTGHAVSGRILWSLAAPLTLGTYLGATGASRLLARVKPRRLYMLAIVYYLVTAAYLTYKALHGQP